MKKTKFLVLVLAVSIMLVGAGYAYWDQTLTLRNTVNTGFLNVSFILPTDDDWDETNVATWDRLPWEYDKTDRVTVYHSPIENGIKFAVGNFYPGAGASLAFKIFNTGSVAAKVKDVTINNINNPALADALEYRFQVVGYNIASHQYEPYDVIVADSLNDLEAKLSSVLADIEIPPRHCLYLGPTNNLRYQVTMPNTISGDDFESQSTSFDLNFNFIQTTN